MAIVYMLNISNFSQNNVTVFNNETNIVVSTNYISLFNKIIEVSDSHR